MNNYKALDLDVNKFSAEQLDHIVSIFEYAKNLPSVNRGLNGCGRVYIDVGYSSIRKSSKFAKMMSAKGWKMFPRPNSKGVSIYMGYDNAVGKIAAQSEAIAEYVRRAGYPCSVDYEGD